MNSKYRLMMFERGRWPRRPRGGVSLTEVLVILAVVGVLLSITAVCLHGMYRVERSAREILLFEDAVARFSLRFRADAHQSGAAELLTAEPTTNGQLPSKVGIAFQLSGTTSRTIDYRFAKGTVVREVRNPEQDAVLHRDAFVLPRESQVVFDVEEQDDATLVVAEIGEPNPKGDENAEPQTRRILAALGITATVPTAKSAATGSEDE